MTKNQHMNLELFLKNVRDKSKSQKTLKFQNIAKEKLIYLKPNLLIFIAVELSKFVNLAHLLPHQLIHQNQAIHQIYHGKEMQFIKHGVMLIVRQKIYQFA